MTVNGEPMKKAVKKSVKTEVVAVRLDRETKERAEERANEEERSLSFWVARLIGREVASSGKGSSDKRAA